MYVTAGNGIDHSKNKPDAVSMEAGKKIKIVAKDQLLPKQLQKLIFPNLQEVTFKADNIKLSDFEASGVELTCRFNNSNPKILEPQASKKEKTIWDKLWLFVVKQSITAYFQWFIEHYQQFIP